MAAVWACRDVECEEGSTVSVPVPPPKRYRWVCSRLADHLVPAALEVQYGQRVLAVCMEQFIVSPVQPVSPEGATDRRCPRCAVRAESEEATIVEQAGDGRPACIGLASAGTAFTRPAFTGPAFVGRGL
jgi:hypothetical protein